MNTMSNVMKYVTPSNEPVIVESIPIDPDTTVNCHFQSEAFLPNSDHGANYTLSSTYFRDGESAPSLVGMPINEHFWSSPTAEKWKAWFCISGNHIQLMTISQLGIIWKYQLAYTSVRKAYSTGQTEVEVEVNVPPADTINGYVEKLESLLALSTQMAHNAIIKKYFDYESLAELEREVRIALNLPPHDTTYDSFIHAYRLAKAYRKK